MVLWFIMVFTLPIVMPPSLFTFPGLHIALGSDSRFRNKRAVSATGQICVVSAGHTAQLESGHFPRPILFGGNSASLLTRRSGVGARHTKPCPNTVAPCGDY